jgi:chromosome segregation ATPase
MEKQIVELIDEKQKTKQEIAEFKQEINQLKSKPSINNQILQVISISPMDNYLDWGHPHSPRGIIKKRVSPNQRLGFIKFIR